MRLAVPLLALVLSGAAGAAPPERFDLIVRGGIVYDGTGAPGPQGGRRGARRSHRRRGRPLPGPGGKGHRGERPGRRPRVHQHAVVGDRLPDRGRPLDERHQAGGHARDLRRGVVDGPPERRHEEGSEGPAGGHQVPDRLDDAGRYLDRWVAAASRRTSRVHRRDHTRVHELGYSDRGRPPRNWRGWRTSRAKRCARERSASARR